MKQPIIQINRNIPNQMPSFTVGYYDENAILVNLVITHMILIDGHYVLKRAEQGRGQKNLVGLLDFGVAHDLEETDRRLYDRAKKEAEYIKTANRLELEIEDHTGYA